jgi:hypothetical protein
MRRGLKSYWARFHADVSLNAICRAQRHKVPGANKLISAKSGEDMSHDNDTYDSSQI